MTATLPAPPLQYALFCDYGAAGREAVAVTEKEREATELARAIEPPEGCSWSVDVWDP
jgi:hypothetical protein